MSPKRSRGPTFENFLDIPACRFRRVERGTTRCVISTDPHVNEVDPLTCYNCEVPQILSVPRCRFLSLGTELKPYRGEGKVVISMSCRELGIRLYDFSTCEQCPYYTEVPNPGVEMERQMGGTEVDLPVTQEQVEQALEELKRDYLRLLRNRRDATDTIRCWRFPEGQCRKNPIFTEKKVTVHLAQSARNDELWERVIVPAIREINLVPYRMEEPLNDLDQACRLCENIQESEAAVFLLDEWNSTMLMLIGVAYGQGKRVVLIRRRGEGYELPLVDYMKHDLLEYETYADIADRLKAYLTVKLG